MKHALMLDTRDKIILSDVLEYLLSDDKERDDFINQYGEEWFNDYMVLELKEVSTPAKSHIYYKTEYLRQQLIETEYGGILK